jgi:hypothetical protein
LALSTVDWQTGLESAKASITAVGTTVSTFFTETDWGQVAADAGTMISNMRNTVNGWRDDILAAATGWVNSVDWSGLSLDLAGFVNRLADGLANIDFEAIDFNGFINGVILGPLSKAWATAKWVMSSDQFAGFKDGVINAIKAIQWGELLGALGNLGMAAVESLTEAANAIINDLIAEIVAVDWTTLSIDFAAMVSSLATKIGEVDWTEVGTSLGTHLRALFVGENGEGGLAGLGAAIRDAVMAIDWPTVLNATGELLASLGTAIKGLVTGAIASLFGSTLQADGAWSTPQWVTDLMDWIPEIPEDHWVMKLRAWIPAVLGAGHWISNLLDWTPADLSASHWVQKMLDWIPETPEWIERFLNWQPAMPGWVQRLLNWIGGDEKSNAVGTPSFPGGWTKVGEFGPEMVRLPAGSKIYSANETQAMMGGQGGSVLNMGPVYVANDVDIEALAYRVATINARRGR